MNSQSIEFDKITEDPTIPKIVRKSFRIPVEDTEKVWVVINEKRYAVLDICIGGIGIALKDNSVFCIDQVLKKCELNLFDLAVKDLEGRIIHFTSETGKKWQCGIQWVDMEEKADRQISKIILKMKEQLLKDDVISFE